jgi:hypothetical protein
MKKTTIFLASSSELASDRDQFEIFIGRKNKELVGRQVFLDLVRWEDFLDAMSKTRLQDEYNKAITNCDIFIMLFFTKVGKYTQEEFEHAFKQFKETNKPFIFTYFKDAPLSSGDIDESVLSLIQFKNKLKELGHFFTVYKNIDELNLKFDRQINKLIENEFISFDKEDTIVPNSIIINQHSSGSGDNVAGDKTVNYKS